MRSFWMHATLAFLAAVATGCGGDDGGVTESTNPSQTNESEPPPEPCPGGGLPPGDDQTFMLTYNGVEFSYIVHVPPGYDDMHRTPLVLNWHGLTSTAEQQRFFSGMNPVADAHNFIVVYPNSPTNSWNAGTCCGPADRDDLGFARALIDEMKAKSCIDPLRIYSTGMSNGGFMSHRLACEAADVIAAAAPVAGVMGLPSCTPSRPVPVMHFHGTADTLVPYDGSGIAGGTPVPQVMQNWADRDGCTTGPTETFRQDDAHCDTWTECDAGVEVGLCTFENEGHCWPGTAFCPFGTSTVTMNASEEMAKFFERFRLP